MMMMISWSCLLVLGMTWATLSGTSPVQHDDTGLLTVGDLMNVGSDMCGMLFAVNDSLNAPAAHLFGVHNMIMSMKLPILHPSALLDPFGVMRFSYEVFSVVFQFVDKDRLGQFSSAEELMTNLSQALSEDVKEIDKEQLALINNINITDIAENSSVDLDGNATNLPNSSTVEVQFDDGSAVNVSLLLTIGDMIQLGGVTCKKLSKWRGRLSATILNQIIHFENIHLPLLDVQHPLDPIKLIDPHGLHRLPSKVISGAMGFIKDLFTG